MAFRWFDDLIEDIEKEGIQPRPTDGIIEEGFENWLHQENEKEVIIMKELNIVINNKYLKNNLSPNDFFGNEESIYIIDFDKDMYDILIYFGIFKSKSEARKNWMRTGKDIPPGYNEFRNIGKNKKSLYIWNPIEIKEEKESDLNDKN